MDLKQQLKESTSKILWSEIRLSILKEVIILVTPDLDLLEVAEACALDKKEAFEKWLQEGKVIRTDSKQHQLWNERNPELECCIVKPFVFIQEVLLN